MPPRDSRAPTAGTPQPGRSSTALPPYEAPSAPLNLKALQALRTVVDKNDGEALKKYQNDAAVLLSDMAGDMHEHHTQRREEAAKAARRAARSREQNASQQTEPEEQNSQEDTEARDADVNAFGNKVNDLTKQMEESLRRMIDEQVYLQASTKALKEVSAITIQSQGRVNVAPTTQAQGNDDSEDGEDEEGQNPPTNDENRGIAVNSLLKESIEKQESEWNKLSLRARYVLLWSPAVFATKEHADQLQLRREQPVHQLPPPRPLRQVP